MKANRSGFTLVEVLVTVAVLAAGIALVLEALSSQALRLMTARDAVCAQQVIRERLAEAEALAAEAGGLEPGTVTGREEVRGVPYVWEMGVARDAVLRTEFPGRPGEAEVLDQVRVSVWREGRDRRYSAVTFLGSKVSHERIEP